METASSQLGSGPLVRFYLGMVGDSSGRFLAEIREWNYDRLEYTHDYVQWLFPTRSRSQFNSSAPTLDEEQIRDFRYSERLQAELHASFRQMLDFYGFCLREGEGQMTIERSPGWKARFENWMTPENHNFLRITRIMTSLRTLGLATQVRALLTALELVYEKHPNVIGDRAIGFWRSAVR